MCPEFCFNFFTFFRSSRYFRKPCGQPVDVLLANSVGDMLSCMELVEQGHIKAKGATRRPSSELKMEDIKVF